MNLEITAKAREKMLYYLKDKDLKEWGIRIVVRMKNDYSFSLIELSKAQPTDTILDEGEIKILIEGISMKSLEGATVDFVESELSRGFKIEFKQVPPIAEDTEIDLGDPKIKKIHDILTREINPSIAAHGGFARLVGFKDNVVYLAMGGGCQGCGMAAVTLKQGIETRLKEAVPEIEEVIDATNHSAGMSPFYRTPQ